jgi:hypothetical protein
VPSSGFRFVNFGISLAAASASIALAALSITNYRSDQTLRLRTRAFLTQFTVDQRRALEAGSVDFAPSGDWAAAIAADAALSDATQSVSLTKLSPELRSLWLENAAQVSEELGAAAEILADAIAVRPGWGIYRYLLGELQYLRLNRTQDVALALRPEKWREPLRLAAAAAPGDDAIWTFLASADLETWQVVQPSARPDSDAVFRRAFLVPDFVARALPIALALLERSHVLSLVPEEVASLGAAFSVVSRGGDVEGCAGLQDRIDRAERRARAEDLRKVGDRFRLGDRDGVLAECRNWTSRHSIRGSDDAVGRAEIARLLEVWPADAAGSWGSDSRTGLVLYALGWRKDETPASALRRAVEALSDVPDPIVARVRLLEGDSWGAEEIVRRSATAGSLEWTPYYLDRAREELRRGKIEAAREAIRSIAPVARAECEALRVARDVARAAKDEGELADLQARLTAATGLADSSAELLDLGPDVWSTGGSLTLCLDPDRMRTKSLVVTLRVQSAADGSRSPSSLVTYGWDGSRYGAAVVRREAVLKVRLGDLAGRHAFSVRVLAGGSVDPVRTEIR